MSLSNYPELEPLHIENLDKLATHLERLPKGYDHFRMAWFFEDNEDAFAERDYAKSGVMPDHCGTAACALGHGPAAGVEMPKECLIGSSADWDMYGELFAPGSNGLTTPLWLWLFSGLWGEHDDTQWGAAARIRYVLADKPLPLLWDGRQDGDYDTVIPLYSPFIVFSD